MKRYFFSLAALLCLLLFTALITHSWSDGKEGDNEQHMAAGNLLPDCPDRIKSIQTRMFTIQVLAGERFSDFMNRYSKMKILDWDALAAFMASEDLSRFPFLPKPSSLPATVDSWRIFEGIFVPGIYGFSENNLVLSAKNKNDFLFNIHTIFNVLLMRSAERYERMGSIMGVPPYDQLIIASIVEKEAVYKEFAAKVASVCYNRYKSGSAVKYQMCSTVEYILGYHRPFLSYDDLWNTDSPYNTYKYSGLCPTPIAFFGDESFNAVNNPEQGKLRFFVVDWAEETMYFNEKYKDHHASVEKSVQNFYSTWGRRNIGRKFGHYYDARFVQILRDEAAAD